MNEKIQMISAIDFLDLLHRSETLFYGEKIVGDDKAYLCYHIGQRYGAIISDKEWHDSIMGSIRFLYNFCERWGKR